MSNNPNTTTTPDTFSTKRDLPDSESVMYAQDNKRKDNMKDNQTLAKDLKDELTTLMIRGNFLELFKLLFSIGIVLALMVLFYFGLPAIALYTLVTGVCKV